MKAVIVGLWFQLRDHPIFLSFMAFMAGILNFVLESAQTVGVIFVSLFIVIAINVWTGIVRAKKEGKFDKKVLKEKTINKLTAYCTALFTVAVATIAIFAYTYKGTQSFIDNYYLRSPLMILELFFLGVEFLSISENLQFNYGIKIPGLFTKRVKAFVEGDQSINDLIKGDDRKE